MNKQREKTKQGIERRVEKSRKEKIERRKEQERTEGTDNNRFWNSRLNKHRKRGEIKNRVTYSSCLHDQQDLYRENNSRNKWRTARSTKYLFKIKVYKWFWTDKMRIRKRSLKINFWMKYLSKTIGKLLDFVIRSCTIKTQMINPYSVSFSTPNETSWHRHDNGNVNLVCSYFWRTGSCTRQSKVQIHFSIWSQLRTSLKINWRSKKAWWFWNNWKNKCKVTVLW